MFQNHKKQSDQKGFTLIETIVTMGIVGILTSIAIGGYLGWRPGYVFRDAVSTVRGGLERAKMRALETRKECKVEFDSDGYEIYDGNYVMNNTSTDWGYVDSDGVFTNSISFLFISLDSYTDDISFTNSSSITFSPHGYVVLDDDTSESDLSIDVVSSNEGTATVAVTVAGNVSVNWP